MNLTTVIIRYIYIFMVPHWQWNFSDYTPGSMHNCISVFLVSSGYNYVILGYKENAHFFVWNVLPRSIDAPSTNMYRTITRFKTSTLMALCSTRNIFEYTIHSKIWRHDRFSKSWFLLDILISGRCHLTTWW